MSNTLYRKYRPQKFSDVIGQKHIVKTITNALKNNRLGQAYLFTGPRGTGKTTTARLLAKAATCGDRGHGADVSRSSYAEAEPCLKCPHCLAMADGSSLDVIEIDAASNTGVDNIRELRDSIKLLPTQAAFKVYIIDEVHMLSIGAFNALLKTLEEPPKHVMFILATTSLHKVPETIVSRCQRFDFSRLPLDNITEKLAGITQSEGVKIDTQALEMIALAAEGGMRDAESLLMQVIAIEDKDITAEEVSSILGITSQQHVMQLIESVAQADTTQSVSLINQLVEDGADLYIFANSLLYTLRQMLLASVDSNLISGLSVELTQEQSEKITALSENLTTTGIIRLIELLQSARKEIRSASLPQLPLEIAVVKFLVPETAVASSAPQTTPRAIPPVAPVQPIQPVAPPAPQTRPAASYQSETPQQKESAQAETVVKEPVAAYEPTASSTIEPETSVVTAASSASTTDIDTVKQKWQAILDKTRELNSSLAMTLGNCQPLRIEEESIVLGVKFPMYRDKLNAIENKLTVESAFDTILESKTRIKVVIDESASPQKPASFTNPTSPLLTEAMSILGGKIVA